MESLLTILGLILLSAISSWLQRRSQRGAGEESWPEGEPTAPLPPDQRPLGRRVTPPREERPRPSRLGDWEAELRRLLEGGEEETPRKPSPPVLTSPGPAQPPSPPPSPRSPSRPLPTPVRTELKPLQAEQVLESEEGGGSVLPSRFYSALSKFRDAQNLQGTIENQMQAAAELRKRRSGPGQTTRHLRRVPPIGRMLRSKQDARLAIVASVVLGPPKGLE